MKDPMADFTDKDWKAIDRQQKHEAVMREIEDARKELSRKKQMILLNQKLGIEVGSILEESFSAIKDDVYFGVIKFIQDNYRPTIIRDSRRLFDAVSVACKYLKEQPIMVRVLLTIYPYLREDCEVDLLSDRYEECRMTLIENPHIINFVFGTEINNQTMEKELFDIHEEIKNVPFEYRTRKIKTAIEKANKAIASGRGPIVGENQFGSTEIINEEAIEEVMGAFNVIRLIESNESKRVKELVSSINALSYDLMDEDEIDLQTHYSI